MQATQSSLDQQEPKYAKAQILYKTELCNKWMTYGTCPYRNQCRFAHGTYELKQRAPPNEYYKTKICFKFFNESACPYGNRCNFRHDQRNVSESKKSYYQYLMNFNQLTQCKGYKPRRLPAFLLLEKGISLDQESNCSTFLQNKEESPLNSGSKEILKNSHIKFTPMSNIDLLGQKDNHQERETNAGQKIQLNLDKNLTSFQIYSVLNF